MLPLPLIITKYKSRKRSLIAIMLALTLIFISLTIYQQQSFAGYNKHYQSLLAAMAARPAKSRGVRSLI